MAKPKTIRKKKDDNSKLDLQIRRLKQKLANYGFSGNDIEIGHLVQMAYFCVGELEVEWLKNKMENTIAEMASIEISSNIYKIEKLAKKMGINIKPKIYANEDGEEIEIEYKYDQGKFLKAISCTVG